MFNRKPKTEQITLDDVTVTLTRKDVKNINLRVYPSKREVHMSAPHHVSTRTVRKFAAAKLPWIRRKLSSYSASAPVKQPLFETGEKHSYQGDQFELKVSFRNAKPAVRLNKKKRILAMQVRPGSSRAKRARVLDEWYRAQLKEQIPKIIHQWEEPMGISVHEFGVKKMKTRWGTCNTRDRRIWLNVALAKKSTRCLEYVVVHEMVHLLERLHNDRFYQLMSDFLPKWEETEARLQGSVD